MRELKIPVITAGIILMLLAYISAQGSSHTDSERVLKVMFLDVGQGDATFIESPTGTQVLIDGGRGGVVLPELQKAMGFFDRNIDMVVATHPDLDHIGGLIDVLLHYNVDTILMTENVSNTPAFEAFQRAVEREGANILFARRGQVFDLGFVEVGSTTLTILFPDRDPSGLESNTSSIVSRLAYGESEYLLTGDSPQEIETYLVSLGVDTLVSDVLKAGHHGSRTSSSEIFVAAVHPTYAIFSAGKDNSYGHPHKEVTDLFNRLGIVSENTAFEGTIISESDGMDIWFR